MTVATQVWSRNWVSGKLQGAVLKDPYKGKIRSSDTRIPDYSFDHKSSFFAHACLNLVSYSLMASAISAEYEYRL